MLCAKNELCVREMTNFLHVKDVCKIINGKGLEKCLIEMCEYIRQDFARWSEFTKCARVANHSDDGVIELMPVSDSKTYSFKYVNGHPINASRGLSTVMAFGVLAHVSSGFPFLVSEMTLTTALRTAATSALAATYMARRNSRTMALIGNGAQAEFQALAFLCIVGINEVRLYDVDPLATKKLVANLQPYSARLKIVEASSIADAVRGCDIVTTVTADKTQATILTPDVIEPGMHLNAVGGDCPGKTELHRDIVASAKVVVEFEPQTRIEGEIQQLPANSPVTHLWEVVKGEALGRDNDAQVTIFDSVGFALEDYSALRYVYDVAVQQQIGAQVELIPELADPKDLYSLLLRQ